MDSSRSNRRPRLIALAALAAVALAACGGSGGGGATTPFPVAASERVWVDETRATPATIAFAGAPARTLRVRIWQPEVERRVPLLIMAHGFGGLPERFEAFAQRVASSGVVVAAPAFPLTNAGAPGTHQVGVRDYLNQPGDLSFAITQLLAAAATSGDPLRGRIDGTAVAVLGHSLGGATTLGLTRKDCCRDERVAASVLAAAPVGLAEGYGADPLAAAGPPTLILHGTMDFLVPYPSGRELFAEIEPPRVFVGLAGAGHSDSLESQVEPPIAVRAAAQRAVVAFLDAVFQGRERELASVLEELAAEGHEVDSDL
jgi:predicted dienelactone hydrolase